MVKRAALFCAFFWLFQTSNPAWAEAIQLSDSSEIKTASEINLALNALSEKVTACVDKNNGKMEGCLCMTYDQCKYKVEYAQARTKFCEAIATYPRWKGKLINFSLPNDIKGYTLAMAAFEKQFGKECK